MDADSAIVNTECVPVPPTPSYTPAPGDVVSFNYDNEACRGIVFKDNYGSLVIARYSTASEESGWGTVNTTLMEVYHNLRKTGDATINLNGLSCSSASDEAKAYFAKQKSEASPFDGDEPDEHTYKVGDLVEFCWFGDWKTVKVTGTEESTGIPYKLLFKNGEFHYGSLVNLRSLSGTYAERQAKAVEFYDIKVGSKVKVVRKFENREGGCDVDFREKACYVGKVFSVTQIDSESIAISTNQVGQRFFPYFVLEPVK